MLSTCRSSAKLRLQHIGQSVPGRQLLRQLLPRIMGITHWQSWACLAAPARTALGSLTSAWHCCIIQTSTKALIPQHHWGSF